MDEPPLFSKNVDDMLPPAPPDDGKIRARTPPTKPAASPALEPETEPELPWWASMLGGGGAILLIMFVRTAVRVAVDGFAGIDWVELGGVTFLAFAFGCVLGLAFWGFDRLKKQFAKPRKR